MNLPLIEACEPRRLLSGDLSIYPWFPITCWGDSITTGLDVQPINYPQEMGRLLNRPVSNLARSGETSTELASRMLAATHTHATTTIIEAGRNNYDKPQQVESDIAAMVASLGNNTHYLVLAVLNGFTQEKGTPSMASATLTFATPRLQRRCVISLIRASPLGGFARVLNNSRRGCPRLMSRFVNWR